MRIINNQTSGTAKSPKEDPNGVKETNGVNEVNEINKIASDGTVIISELSREHSTLESLIYQFDWNDNRYYYDIYHAIFDINMRMVGVFVSLNDDENFKMYLFDLGKDLRTFQEVISDIENMIDQKDEKTKAFIYKCMKIHGNRYNYSTTIYKNSRTKIAIICHQHKIFYQSPRSHVTGLGCRFCAFKIIGMKTRESREEFIKQSKLLHGDKFNYDAVDYVSNDKCVKIFCTISSHGFFLQTPSHHLVKTGRGGCPKCAIKNISLSNTLTQEKFIERISKKKSCKNYSFDKTVFIDRHTEITVHCKSHGDFKILPSSLTQGVKCQRCSSNFVDTKKFIENATKKFGERYDYSLVEYKTKKIPVKIICKKHGIFNMRPFHHLSGCGCSGCNCHGHSQVQIEWLNFLGKMLGIDIYHAKNMGEHLIKNSKYHADGYCKEKNIIFEFNGCFFHGCKKCFKNRNSVNKLTLKTHDELYDNTAKRKEFCQNQGYSFVSVWECDWKKIKKSPDLMKNYLDTVRKKLNIDMIDDDAIENDNNSGDVDENAKVDENVDNATNDIYDGEYEDSNIDNEIGDVDVDSDVADNESEKENSNDKITMIKK